MSFESTLMHRAEQVHLYNLPNETRTFRCAFCGEDVPLYDRVQEITDKPVCSDCIGKYCTERIENDTDLVNSFIKNHEVDFYLSYYLKGLTQKELLELIKRAFERKEQLDRIVGSDEHRTIKREFCLEHDRFFWFF